MIISGSLSLIALSINCTASNEAQYSLNIRERCLILLAYTQKIRRSVQIIVEFLIFRSECTCLRFRTHNCHVNRVTFMRPFPHDCACPRTSSSGWATTNKYFIVFVFIYLKFKHCVIILHLSIVFFASSTSSFSIQVHSLPHTA